MDALFTKDKIADFNYRNDELLAGDWSGGPDDIFDSIFSMDNDFLNDFVSQENNFNTSIEDLSRQIKMEAEDYQLTVPTYNTIEIINGEENNDNKQLNDPQSFNVISSSSSDSGLSSDNLDVEMSPVHEPLSPAISSPGPSISESGDQSPYRNNQHCVDTKINNNIIINKTVTNESTPSKVVVHKIPQIITLSPDNVVKSNKINLVNGKEIKIVKLSPQMFTTNNNNNGNNRKVTIQVKNSNTGAKIQSNPQTIYINNPKLTEVKKVVRVQNASNPRSVLLPVSIQNMKDLKAFKIVNASSLKSETTKIGEIFNNNIHQVHKISNKCSFIKERTSEDCSSDHTSDGESYLYEEVKNEHCQSGTDYSSDRADDHDASYPKLILTAEEKRLLAKEGITLPTHYPLTKHEERELKRIRRKIRNKISAQDSRKRKKEYVDGLEERVKQCTEENQTLMKRIKLLQAQNQNLMSQMKKLQLLLSKGTNKTAHPTTCLMVLLLSLALIAAPNLKLGQNAKENELEQAVQETVLQNRRNLLFNIKDQNKDILDDEINMNDIFTMNESYNDNEYVPVADSFINSNTIYSNNNNNEPQCKKSKLMIDFDVDDQNWYERKDIMEDLKKSTDFNKLAENYQSNSKMSQTSGFNIKNELNFNQTPSSSLLDHSNEINLERVPNYSSGETILDIAVKHVFDTEISENTNFSQLKDVKKY